MMSVDDEIVEALRRSREAVGYLLPVVKDQDGNIISGRHRKYADAKWPEIQVEVKDSLQRELLSLHYNIQRKPSKEETRLSLLRIAKMIEARGTPQEDVASNLASLVPFTSQYVRELMPEKYKHTEFRSKEPKPVSAKPAEWPLRYMTFPIIPEHFDTVSKAISLEKKKLDTDNPGEALWSICTKYLENQK
mgnify:CR=1 FL=1